MKGQKRRSRRRDPTLGKEDGPSVSAIIDGMEETRGQLVSHLRDLTLSLDEVREVALFDAFCREWTPAFYLGRTQLFHVHNFRAGLRATMFVGVKTLDPLILHSEEVAPEMRRLVADTSAPGTAKEVRVPLTSLDDVPFFMDLVRLKWAFAREQPRRAPTSG